MIFWIVSMFCLCMDYNRLNHPSKSKCLSVQTQCTGLVSHGMLVTLVTFIYRFVCYDMSPLLDHVLQWQREEVFGEKRCVYITGMLLHFVRFSFFIVVFFLLEFCGSREQTQKYSKHWVTTGTWHSFSVQALLNKSWSCLLEVWHLLYIRRIY